MDPTYYNGDVDPRDFGPDPHEDDCQDCGARYDAPCEPFCDCPPCVQARTRHQRDEDAA